MDVDIGEKAREVVRRLSEVDLGEVRLDRPRVEAALNEFLARLGLPRRAVRWAGGPGEAFSQVGSLKGYLTRAEVARAIAEAAKRPGKKSSHTQAHEAASKAAAAAVRARIWWAVREGVSQSFYGDEPNGWDWEMRGRIEGLWELSRSAHVEAQWCAAESARMYGTECFNEASQEFAAIKLPLVDAYEAGLWVYWIASEEMLAVPRPALRLHEGRLHGDGEPAARWESGECLYSLNGVFVPEGVALTPARDLDCGLVVRTRNVEVRREIVRKIGIERVVTDLGAVRLDSEGDYELLLLDLGDRRRRPFLKMRNPSIGVFHVEGVHPDCRTVREALAWRNGTDAPPSILT